MIDFIYMLIDSYIEKTGKNARVILCHPTMADRVKANVDPTYIVSERLNDGMRISACGLTLIQLPDMVPGCIMVSERMQKYDYPKIKAPYRPWWFANEVMYSSVGVK